MIPRSAAVLVLVMSSLGQAVQIRVATFNVGAKFEETSGGAYVADYGIGPAGNPDHDTVRDVLARIDADVVTLQEIHEDDVTGNDVSDLAASLGYPYVHIATDTNAFDPFLLVAFLSRFPFISQTIITSPTNYKDMTRLIPVVKVDVPGTTRDPVLIGAHLKVGTSLSDIFQRTVEMRRIAKYLTTSGLTVNDNFVILGDFNLNPSVDDRTFSAIPGSGLPSGFNLGPDITFPITYSPYPTANFGTPSVRRLNPLQLDGSPITHPPAEPDDKPTILDLFMVSPAIGSRPHHTEIYNSALDTSNTAGLPKSGSPLAAETSAAASDHLAVFGDIELDPALPYEFSTPAQTVSETFTNFAGTYDPYPWATTGGTWQGVDGGASTAPGFRAYGTGGEPALGFVPDATGGTATATFVNQSPTTLTALQISYTAEQWRSSTGGTADTLAAELIVAGVPSPLPALGFSAATNLSNGAIASGVSTPRSTVVSGLTVAPGVTFQLRFTFTPGAGGGAQPADIFVNEFHYDNVSTDTGEFIEVVAGPGFAGNFSDIDVQLYNGGDGTVYKTINLEGPDFIRTTTSNNFNLFVTNFSGSTVQNGPDGIAIVNKLTRQTLQFISYEGSSFAATDGITAGLTSTNIGVVQTGSEPVGSSALGLIGSGGVRTNFSWSKIAGLYSKGSANTGQSLVNPTMPPQGIAIDNLAVTFLTGGDTDGDGFSDADEVVFGTNPADAASRFVVNFAYQTPAPGMLRVSFPTQTGRSYVIESCTDFTDWDDVATYSGSGSPQVADFPVSPADPQRFYRVRVTFQ